MLPRQAPEVKRLRLIVACDKMQALDAGRFSAHSAKWHGS
jgi:hypothetical protein